MQLPKDVEDVLKSMGITADEIKEQLKNDPRALAVTFEKIVADKLNEVAAHITAAQEQYDRLQAIHASFQALQSYQHPKEPQR